MSFTAPTNSSAKTTVSFLPQQPFSTKTTFSEMFERIARSYNAMLTSMHQRGAL